jgi:soluble lytic murein transglycosylase-like protein
MALLELVATRSAHLLFPRRRSASKFTLPAGTVTRLRSLWPLFRSAGQRFNLSPYILAGIAIGESGLDPRARNSTTGAAGIMQLMPGHFSRLGWAGDDWADPAKNIPAGAQILADQVKAHGTIERALAGYGGFTSWLRDPTLATVAPDKRPGKDASWYIDEALGRAWLLQVANEAGSLRLDASS